MDAASRAIAAPTGLREQVGGDCERASEFVPNLAPLSSQQILVRTRRSTELGDQRGRAEAASEQRVSDEAPSGTTSSITGQ